MYESTITCPVCDAVFDVQTHAKKEMHAQSTAMLAGEHRRDHGRESPACVKHKDWIQGWNISTRELPDEDEKQEEEGGKEGA